MTPTLVAEAEQAVLDTQASRTFVSRALSRQLPRALAETAGANLVRTTKALEAQLHWTSSYWAVAKYPLSGPARELAGLHAQRYLTELATLVETVEPEAKALLQAEQTMVQTASQLLTEQAPSTVPAAAVLSRLDRLRETALAAERTGDPKGVRLSNSFRRWEKAAHGSLDLQDVPAAGASLKDSIDRFVTRTVGKQYGLARVSAYARDIDTAVDQLGRIRPRIVSVAMMKRVQRLVINKDPQLQELWIRLRSAVAHSSHTWDRLMCMVEDVAREGNALTAARRETAVGHLQGLLGELVARAEPEYVTAFQDAAQRANEVAATFNYRAGKNVWRVMMPQTDLYAPGLKTSALRLFLDDSILIINDVEHSAYLIFAAEVKAGDASSRGAVEQLIKDQARMLKGSISIGKQAWALLPPTTEARLTRVFVGAKLPSEAKISTVPNVRFTKASADQRQLRTLAEKMIQILRREL